MVRFNLLASAMAILELIGQPTLAKPGAASAATKATAPGDRTDAKLALLFTLINSESATVFENRRSWTKNLINGHTEPNCQEKDVGLAFRLNGQEGMKYDEYRRQLATKPKFAIDNDALKMVETLDELRKLSEIWWQGFRKFPLTDDECQKLKDLHQSLITHWARYSEANAALRSFVDKYNTEHSQSEIKEVEKKYGKRYRYHRLTLVAESAAVARMVDDQSESLQPNAQPILDQLSRLTKTLNNSQSLMDADRDAKQSSEAYPDSFKEFFDSVRRFEKSVKEYLLAIEDKEAKDRAATLRTKAREISNNLNALTDSASSVAFEKNQK